VLLVSVHAGENIRTVGCGVHPERPVGRDGAPAPAELIPLSKDHISTFHSRGHVSSPLKNHSFAVAQGSQKVSFARGGNWAKMHGGPLRSPLDYLGKRGEILRFSPSSRRRCNQLMNSIDRTLVGGGDWVFATLTYGDTFPSPIKAKEHLWAFIERFERRYGNRAIIWKLEPQKRAAPHFHLLLVLPESDCSDHDADLLAWFSANWVDVACMGGLEERRKMLAFAMGQARNKRGELNKPCLSRLVDWNRVSRYASKYVTKICDDAGWGTPGRFWGVVNRAELPVEVLEVELPAVAAVKLRRLMVQYYEKQSTNRFIIKFSDELKFRGVHRGGRAVAQRVDGRCRVVRDDNKKVVLDSKGRAKFDPCSPMHGDINMMAPEGFFRMSFLPLPDGVEDFNSAAHCFMVPRRWHGDDWCGISLFIPAAVFQRMLAYVLADSS
jgi:hypothetical protein